jgi:hypothetical protein
LKGFDFVYFFELPFTEIKFIGPVHSHRTNIGYKHPFSHFTFTLRAYQYNHPLELNYNKLDLLTHSESNSTPTSSNHPHFPHHCRGAREKEKGWAGCLWFDEYVCEYRDDYLIIITVFLVEDIGSVFSYSDYLIF